jgi:C_GCAxxG_C_C family probable redox protein
MKNQEIREKVYKYYGEGYHCAETIFNTIKELHSIEDNNTCKLASGFCGGIGKCHQDICGALAGGIMVLGSLYGREKGGEDINKLVYLSVELRQSFIQKFKSTVCKDVIENSKNIPGIESCKDVTSETTILLHQLIENHKNE